MSLVYIGSLQVILAELELVMACMAAGTMPPPGWPEADENAIGVTDASTFRKGDSKSSP